jgi:surface antigen
MRSFVIAATALAAGAPSGAEALAVTPFSIDASATEVAPGEPSPFAVAPPSAFARLPDSAFEPAPSLNAAGPRLQCVPFAREASGVSIYGDASTWWAQAAGRYERARAPEEGAVIVMRGFNNPNRGHVAVVREVVSERMILVDHANWLNRGEITRSVPVRDVSAAGDWSQVQVWHVPGGHWGARTYAVRGFIADRPADAQSAQAASAPVG